MSSAIEYREHRPSPVLARYIECFWTIETALDQTRHTVLPDGCADILFVNSGSRPAELLLIGGMTVARRGILLRGQRLFGIRFRPGMWNLFLSAPWGDLTDSTRTLEQVVDGRAKRLSERLENSRSVAEMIRVTEAWLGPPRPETVVQHVAEHMAQEHGQMRVNDLSGAAGLSTRQLRRLFVEQTGLAPKELAKVLRFRHSVERLRSTELPAPAQLAIECGYYDQAHFINEFRAFSGSTPGQYQARSV